MPYKIESRDPSKSIGESPWTGEGIGEPNEFASHHEAWRAMRELPRLGGEWARYEYRVTRITWLVVVITSSGQPARVYNADSRAEAIRCARDCAKSFLLERSGGSVTVYRPGDEARHSPIWTWLEHAEGGYGSQDGPNGTERAIRL